MQRNYILSAVVALALATSMASCSKPAAETASSEPKEMALVAEPVPMTKDQILAAYNVPASSDTIDPTGAQTTEVVEKALAANPAGAELKLKGVVNSVCKEKGCWMKLEMPDGKLMHVTFKDYSFFVPKDMQKGQEVIVDGMASQDTISVDDLRHYAEDDHKSAAEIAAITKPEVTIVFNANGVLIPKATASAEPTKEEKAL